LDQGVEAVIKFLNVPYSQKYRNSSTKSIQGPKKSTSGEKFKPKNEVPLSIKFLGKPDRLMQKFLK
jgi:hypothetical protein